MKTFSFLIFIALIIGLSTLSFDINVAAATITNKVSKADVNITRENAKALKTLISDICERNNYDSSQGCKVSISIVDRDNLSGSSEYSSAEETDGTENINFGEVECIEITIDISGDIFDFCFPKE